MPFTGEVQVLRNRACVQADIQWDGDPKGRMRNSSSIVMSCGVASLSISDTREKIMLTLFRRITRIRGFKYTCLDRFRVGRSINKTMSQEHIHGPALGRCESSRSSKYYNRSSPRRERLLPTSLDSEPVDSQIDRPQTVATRSSDISLLRRTCTLVAERRCSRLHSRLSLFSPSFMVIGEAVLRN